MQSNINFSTEDIFKIDYSKYDCAYFDIPYEDTGTYNVNKGDSFNHAMFWDLFSNLSIPAYASSYKAPDNIKEVASFKNRKLFIAKSREGENRFADEKLYFNNKTKMTGTSDKGKGDRSKSPAYLI